MGHFLLISSWVRQIWFMSILPSIKHHKTAWFFQSHVEALSEQLGKYFDLLTEKFHMHFTGHKTRNSGVPLPALFSSVTTPRINKWHRAQQFQFRINQLPTRVIQILMMTSEWPTIWKLSHTERKTWSAKCQTGTGMSYPRSNRIKTALTLACFAPANKSRIVIDWNTSLRS